MFGKMMNRYYYGKSGKGDYTKEDLPTSRWQLFWEMLRVRFAALFKLNLLYVIGWLPAIFVIGRAVMMVYSGVINTGEMQMQVEAGEMAAAALTEANANLLDAVKVLLLQTLFLLVPCIAITGPFTAGIAYVTRNWARDEHAFVLSDFVDAVKGNWKQALLSSTITGFVPLLLYVCTTFYGDMAASNPLYYVPEVLVFLISILWLCAQMYIYPQMVTYRINFRGLVRNSLIMVVGRFPMTLGLKLLSLLPLLICLIVSLLTPYAQYAMLVYGAYYILIGYALSRFVQASYANAVFDRYLNPNIEGAQVGRGLYVEEDDEEEEETVETDENAGM